MGHGFKPMRKGGSLQNAIDLMEYQLKKGFQVHYLFSGRYYPFLKMKIRTYEKNQIIMHELINSPILPGKCVIEKDDYKLQNLFRDVIEAVNPDIIHIQELLGLPYSLIDMIKEEYKIPLVMTFHDYYSLCPTINLYRFDRNCFEKNVGDMCTLCCKNCLSYHYFLFATLAYHLENFKIPIFKIYNEIFRVKEQINPKKSEETQIIFPVSLINSYQKISKLFQKRRDLNVKRLEKIDFLISPSKRTKKIYQNFLKPNTQISVIQNSLNHISDIGFKKMEKINTPIKFGILNGFSSVEKGSEFLLKALNFLKLDKDDYNFYIWGQIDKSRELELRNYKNIFIKGEYDVSDIDKILESIDVGIIPSVWEEVYGFIGLEFLSKGIPVIGNNLGGIREYIIDNVTGWINKDSSPDGLARIMEGIIQNPQKIIEINQKIGKNMNEILIPYEKYGDEVIKIYLELLE